MNSKHPSTHPSYIDPIIKNRRVIITCGTGGVGKTTLSAAIAIRAALLGKRTVVITIDPAKRLANSLGFDKLQDAPTDLTTQVHAAFNKIQSKIKQNSFEINLNGSLSAIVPDTRDTFENFARELAPHPKIAEKLIHNPIFQIFAREFSGANEYMALERLLALYKKQEYDCIVLDTPPSRNMMAFLNAPHLLTQFFEERIIRWLILPANKLISTGMKKALGILENLTGSGFMTHLFDFASSLFEVQIKFTSNLKKITSILESPEVGFLIITSPTAQNYDEIELFLKTLRQHKFHDDGIIINRTIEYLNLQTIPVGFEKPFAVLQARQNREQEVIKNLMKHPTPICAKIPELARDIHSVEDLIHVAMALHSSTLANS